MKKAFSLAISAVVLSLSLVSCQNARGNNKASNKPNKPNIVSLDIVAFNDLHGFRYWFRLVQNSDFNKFFNKR